MNIRITRSANKRHKGPENDQPFQQAKSSCSRRVEAKRRPGRPSRQGDVKRAKPSPVHSNVHDDDESQKRTCNICKHVFTKVN